MLVSSRAVPDQGTGCLWPFSPFAARGETTQNQTQFCLLCSLCTETSTTRQLWDGAHGELADGPDVITIFVFMPCLWMTLPVGCIWLQTLLLEGTLRGPDF